MNNIINYKNKNIGVLGLGLSGISAVTVLQKSEANIFAFDDNKIKPRILSDSIWMNYQNWPWRKLQKIIVSPGIPINGKNKHKAIQLAIKNNVEIINDIDLFMETKPKAKIIGITGTNGKSTTVALLYHILKFNGIKCVIGGNFGYPACELLDPGENGVIILELSSYQLDGTSKLALNMASIINITPDHLDYHETYEIYKSCKLKILDFLENKGKILINESNVFLNKEINIKKHPNINLVKVKVSDYKEIINQNISLKGEHNYINASLAICLARNFKIDDNNIISSIKTFQVLPHRMEYLYNSDKIKIINDSKSTNGESTAAALNSFHNIFWIVGGKPKSDGIGNAKNHLNRVIEGFLIGKSTNFFSKEILKYNKKIPLTKCNTLENATNLAIEKAKKFNLDNSVILLSPSAASFDQFKNFEDRGNRFKQIICDHLEKGVLK